MHVGFVGSRDFEELGRVEAAVAKLAARAPQATVVSGGARGVDRHAASIAKRYGLDRLEWTVSEENRRDRTGRFRIVKVLNGFVCQSVEGADSFPTFAEAAFKRNEYIVRDSDVILAFWDGESRGTKHTIRVAETQGVPVYAYLPTG